MIERIRDPPPRSPRLRDGRLPPIPSRRSTPVASSDGSSTTVVLEERTAGWQVVGTRRPPTTDRSTPPPPPPPPPSSPSISAPATETESDAVVGFQKSILTTETGKRCVGVSRERCPGDGNGQTLRRCVPRTLSWRRKREAAAALSPSNAVLAAETGSTDSSSARLAPNLLLRRKTASSARSRSSPSSAVDLIVAANCCPGDNKPSRSTPFLTAERLVSRR